MRTCRTVLADQEQRIAFGTPCNRELEYAIAAYTCASLLNMRVTLKRGYSLSTTRPSTGIRVLFSNTLDIAQ